ncbi:retrovirus-related Pol polyprotein from transposon opus [Trichonephila clavipes]|nr:retrovirus-related Pol polyprotein from transposon opus [Trichonephila clavipes]
MILEGLTDGLPINLRQLLTINPLSNPTEWIVTMTKLLKIQNSEQNKIENHSICRTPIFNVPRENYQNWKPRHFRPNKFAQSQVPNQTPRTLNSPKMHFQSNLPPNACRFCECQGIQNAYHWAQACPFRFSAIQVPPQIPMQPNVDPPTEESQIWQLLEISGYIKKKPLQCVSLIPVQLSPLYLIILSPFGIKVAPAIFNRLIRRILTKYKIDFACNYFDDIIVFSSSEKEHWNHLKTILDICPKENIKLKLSKCVFVQTKINFLGYEIEEDKGTPNNTDIDIIKKLRPPNSVKELQRFLGSINVYQHIPEYADLRYPLNVIKKGCKI